MLHFVFAVCRTSFKPQSLQTPLFTRLSAHRPLNLSQPHFVLPPLNEYWSQPFLESLSPSHALRLLHVCAFCGNGDIWSDGIPIHTTEQEGLGCYLRRPCPPVPTIHQDCSWKGDVECGGCSGGGVANRCVDKRENFGMIVCYDFVLLQKKCRFAGRIQNC